MTWRLSQMKRVLWQDNEAVKYRDLKVYGSFFSATQYADASDVMSAVVFLSHPSALFRYVLCKPKKKCHVGGH